MNITTDNNQTILWKVSEVGNGGQRVKLVMDVQFRYYLLL